VEEIGSRMRNQPAPPGIVFEDLCDPHVNRSGHGCVFSTTKWSLRSSNPTDPTWWSGHRCGSSGPMLASALTSRLLKAAPICDATAQLRTGRVVC
jgi:hypothetical protein